MSQENIENQESPESSQTFTVAVLGATGLVGSHLISILEERKFPVKTLKPLASQRSAGGSIKFRDEDVPVELACPEAFDGVDIVLASAGGSVSEALVPEAVKRGCVVIDNTSCFRMDKNVPLVVAGVNDEDVEEHQGIIANPNCSTAQLMPVLRVLQRAGGLKRVIVSTYQSVSGSGKAGMDELKASTKQQVNDENVDAPNTFQRPIAFNLIPHIDVFLEDDPVYGKDLDGYTKEEAKLICETRKILHLPDLKITATAIRVPVMIGHSESVTVDLDRALSPQKAERLLAQNPDIVVSKDINDYHTPAETAGTDPVYVSRIRRDNSNLGQGLNMWVVSDNLRIGAALNAVRIAEVLVKRDRLKARIKTAEELAAEQAQEKAEAQKEAERLAAVEAKRLSEEAKAAILANTEPAKRHVIEPTKDVLQHVEDVEIAAIESHDDFMAERIAAEAAKNATEPKTGEEKPEDSKTNEIPMHPSLSSE